MLMIMDLSYIIATCDKVSSLTRGILYMLFLGIYVLCMKCIAEIEENMMFVIGVICIGISIICCVLSVLLSQQMILFSLLMLSVGMINLIGRIIIKYI